jgi:TonB family protein
MRGVGLIALAVSLAVPAVAAEKTVPPSEAGWVQTPAPEEYRAALGKIVTSGALHRVVARCAVEDEGALTGCKVVRETPTAIGLGDAFLTLMPKYRRKPPGKHDPRVVGVVWEGMEADTPPDWVRRPTAAELRAVWPTEAIKKGQSGQAIINCIVTTQGALTACEALEETPPGAGFGGAAIALTPQFLMKPARSKGQPVMSVATIPINFKTYGALDVTGSKKVATGALAWMEAPTYDDVVSAYPAKARAEKRGGRATLDCDLTEAGRLTSCQVLTSEPKGYGFDMAAKALAKRFAMPVRTDSERKATHQLVIHLPFVFDPAMLDPSNRVVGKPIWAMTPTREQLVGAFTGLEVQGTARAVLRCRVLPAGGVGDCSVASETPAGAGVGAAALKLAPFLKLSTWTAEGLPVVGGGVNIPIRYDGAPAAEPAPPAPAR